MAPPHLGSDTAHHKPMLHSSPMPHSSAHMYANNAYHKTGGASGGSGAATLGRTGFVPVTRDSLWMSEGSSSSATFRVQQYIPSTSQLKLGALVLSWYICSSVTNNLGKLLLTEFNYPVTLTVFQFFFVAFYSIAYVAVHRKVTSGEPYSIRPVSRTVLRVVVPLAAFNIIGHVFSAYAIAHASVSFVHTVKALSPLFTVALSSVVLRVQYSRAVYASLLPLVVGVMLACWSEVSYNAVGFFCALSSSLIFVIQNLVSKKAFVSGTFDELNLLLHSAWVAFVIMLPMWLYSEGFSIIFGDVVIEPYVVLLFFLNGVAHFGQNILAFTMMTLVTPVSYSIASLMKRVFVIGAAIIWFATPFTPQNLLGLILTFVGLYMYQQAKPGKSTESNNHSNSHLPRFSENGPLPSPSDSLIGGR